MMPKSTATSRPCVVDEQVAGMHVGVEEAVAQRMAQEALDHRAAEALQIEALGFERGAIGRAACRRSIPASARRARCDPSRPPARGNPDRPWCSPPSPRARPLRAADPSRSRPSGASVVDHLDQPQPPRLGRQALGLARGEEKRVEIDLEAPLDAGPQHLDRDGAAAAVGHDLGAMHLRDRGGGDRRAEAREQLASAACRTRLRPRASASACGNGAILSCRLSRSRASRGADHVRPRRQELAELHVGGPEPGQRGGEPVRRPLLALGRSISRASADAARAGNGSARGSTRPNTPSRANTKPARPRRARWARAQRSQPPAGMQRDDAAGHRRERDAAKAGGLDHVGEGLRLAEICGSIPPDSDRPRASPVTARPSAGITLKE